MIEASRRVGEVVDDDLQPFSDLVEAEQVPFVIVDGAVMLRGSESRSSGVRAFPPKPVAPVTGERDMQEFLFGPAGTLYSFSTVHVSSSRATPYTIGYVDFPEGVRVLSEVCGDDLSSLACDAPVELRADGDAWFVVPTGGEN